MYLRFYLHQEKKKLQKKFRSNLLFDSDWRRINSNCQYKKNLKYREIITRLCWILSGNALNRSCSFMIFSVCLFFGQNVELQWMDNTSVRNRLEVDVSFILYNSMKSLQIEFTFQNNFSFFSNDFIVTRQTNFLGNLLWGAYLPFRSIFDSIKIAICRIYYFYQT